jgi:hypothetical protein
MWKAQDAAISHRTENKNTTKEGNKCDKKTRLNKGECKINRKQIILDGMGRRESNTPTRNANSRRRNTEQDKRRLRYGRK